MSSIYLVMWLYIGSTPVNVIGAGVLVLVFAAKWYLPRHADR
jgi:uncharacterized membrane protein